MRTPRIGDVWVHCPSKKIHRPNNDEDLAAEVESNPDSDPGSLGDLEGRRAEPLRDACEEALLAEGGTAEPQESGSQPRPRGRGRCRSEPAPRVLHNVLHTPDGWRTMDCERGAKFLLEDRQQRTTSRCHDTASCDAKELLGSRVPMEREGLQQDSLPAPSSCDLDELAAEVVAKSANMQSEDVTGQVSSGATAWATSLESESTTASEWPLAATGRRDVVFPTSVLRVPQRRPGLFGVAAAIRESQSRMGVPVLRPPKALLREVMQANQFQIAKGACWPVNREMTPVIWKESTAVTKEDTVISGLETDYL
mmetsp:Transcript_20869/g.39822  ORF Transcript_20869/g.39822 Transcript_20869/m.39822 type:complete len:310 (-) Transcript_20869:110-1039(-)